MCITVWHPFRDMRYDQDMVILQQNTAPPLGHRTPSVRMCKIGVTWALRNKRDCCSQASSWDVFGLCVGQDVLRGEISVATETQRNLVPEEE